MCHSLSLCEQMVMGWELVNDKSEELALPGGWSPNRPILHNEKWDRRFKSLLWIYFKKCFITNDLNVHER